jgi:hypothetical protein
MAVSLKITAIRDVAQCSLEEIDRRFRGTHQGDQLVTDFMTSIHEATHRRATVKLFRVLDMVGPYFL